MEKTHHSKPEHIGSIIEQWFKRFELIAKYDVPGVGYSLREGKAYPVVGINLENRELSLVGDEGDTTEWFRFDEVPDYFEIRIREA